MRREGQPIATGIVEVVVKASLISTAALGGRARPPTDWGPACVVR
ncbi:hypothetical protein [Streptomyces sp. NPDC007369]